MEPTKTDPERIDLGHGYSAEHAILVGRTYYRILDADGNLVKRTDDLRTARAFVTRRVNTEAKRPTFRVSLYAVSDHGATPVLVGTTTVRADSYRDAELAAYSRLWADFHGTERAHELYLVTREGDAS